PRSSLISEGLPKNRVGWWPGIVWLAGFGLVVGRAGLSHLVFGIYRRREEAATEAALCERVQSLARLLGIRRQIRVVRLRRLSGPIAFGILRPTIGLSEGFCNFTSAQREAMLVHELAHLSA